MGVDPQRMSSVESNRQPLARQHAEDLSSMKRDMRASERITTPLVPKWGNPESGCDCTGLVASTYGAGRAFAPIACHEPMNGLCETSGAALCGN